MIRIGISRAARLCGLLGAALALGCGGDGSDIMGSGEQPPFGGREIKFQSTYAYFPSDFSVSIIRDTIPQEDVCRLLAMYSAYKPPLKGLPVLPYKQEHYALVITVDSVMPGDDVTLDPTDTGGAGDMRYAGIGQFGIGNNTLPSFTARAGGLVRIGTLEQRKRVAGRYSLKFATGETIEESFDVEACPASPSS